MIRGVCPILLLAKDLGQESYDCFAKIDAMAGMVAAIERGFSQVEIAESTYRLQQVVDCNGRALVGVNRYQSQDEALIRTRYTAESIDKHLADTISIDPCKGGCHDVSRITSDCRRSIRYAWPGPWVRSYA